MGVVACGAGVGIRLKIAEICGTTISTVTRGVIIDVIQVVAVILVEGLHDIVGTGAAATGRSHVIGKGVRVIVI